MEANDKCIFFAGGKKFNLEPDSGSITLKKIDGGNFEIVLKGFISEAQAGLAIQNYGGFPTNAAGNKIIPANTLYIESYTGDAIEPLKEISLSEATFNISFDNGNLSELSIKSGISGSGKTQHVGG